MLKIHGRAGSINVRKVLWCCDELAIPYVREDWGAGFRPTHSEEFLKLNPNGLVPVIDDDGFVLWQSNSIIRYLAARTPHLYPAKPRERAVIDQWIDWQATELNDAWRYAFMNLVRHSPVHQDTELARQSIAQWSRMMGLLDAHLQASGGYAAGTAFTLADIPIGLSVHRWYCTPMPRPDLRSVDTYYRVLKQRPAFATHLADP